MDINLRPPWWSEESVKPILQEAKWIKLNQDELAQLVPQVEGTKEQTRYLFQQLSLDLLVITQGSAGATALSATNERHHVSPKQQTRVVDTVGAGDAFSSVLLLGQMLDWSMELTLERAQEFASAIVGVRGATVSEREFYQPFLDAWVSAAC